MKTRESTFIKLSPTNYMEEITELRKDRSKYIRCHNLKMKDDFSLDLFSSALINLPLSCSKKLKHKYTEHQFTGWEFKEWK